MTSMMHNSAPLGVAGSARIRVLLLGDDGRMARLLSSKRSLFQVDSGRNVFEGIMRLSERSYDAVFLNAERPGERTSDVVKALRRAAPTAKVLLYGEPFAEGYARPALSLGADQFLVWPVPINEIMQQVRADQPAAGPAQPMASQPGLPLPISDIQWMGQMRSIAEQIPHGAAALIGRAEKELAQILGLSWAKVKLENQASQDSAPTAPSHQIQRRLPLKGSQELLGELLLGPNLETAQNNRLEFAEKIAAFLATLIDLAQRDETLKYLATVDELTGARNRRYLEHFVQEVIEQGRQRPTHLTLLLFDIDEFKHYNDTYGHAAGDEVLRETTRLMKRCFRGHDIVARMGGDEFAVAFWDSGEHREPKPQSRHDIITDAGADQNNESLSDFHELALDHDHMVMFLSNRFRRIMRTSEFPMLGEEARGVLTISGGLARYPEDGTTLKDLLLKADEAMLTAKRQGKNRIFLVGHPADPAETAPPASHI